MSVSGAAARGYTDDANMEQAQEYQRSSGGSGSGRSSGGRSGKAGSTNVREHEEDRGEGRGVRTKANTGDQQPQQQLSTIEKSVTHLLVATKQLLETLTMWSRGTATESEVSDVYVRLGYEFNIACRAFGAIGVDTSDLGPVPDLLRTILEDTLSQEASQQSLDKFLPRIRDIIINLLHGLKKKQQRLRHKGGGSTRENSTGALPPRQASVASNVSLESSLTQQLEDVPSRQTSSRSFAHRQGSAGEIAMPELPPRTTSAQTGSGTGRSSPRRHGLSPQNSMHASASRDTMASDTSSLSSNALQNIPVIAPYPEQDTIPTNQQPYSEPQRSPSPEPPRPPPKQNDALSALQRGGDLERRASRRFSAYQIQKHLGTSMNGIAAIPPAQHSPVPNRVRDVRESLSAVRSRGSILHSRARSKNAGAYQQSPAGNEVRRISEESSQGEKRQQREQQRVDTQLQPEPVEKDGQQVGSPMVKTPEDKLAQYPFPQTPSSPDKASATLNGPMDEPFYYGNESPVREKEPEKAPIPKRSDSRKAIPQVEQRTPPQSTQFVPEVSPQPGKELTLFLQYKSKIKKFVLPGGSDDLTLARLQLGFIEKFAWNTQNNGADLPEIYIQDPVSGVRHELEDLADVKERSVLVLNVEALDEVKRHFDEGLGGLRRIVESIKDGVTEQGTKLERVSERQTEMSREVAGLAAAPAPTTTAGQASTGSSSTPKGPIGAQDKKGQLTELQALRRDLAVVRQTYTSFVSDMQASMTTIRTKAASVKKAAVDAPVPDLDPSSGRGYVNDGKKTLSEDSEKIVNKVDDLQDMVEDLRKDVVTRGVRPLPRQLEEVSKDISQATKDLKKLQEFLRREKPVWTKIWEKELQVVCDDRDLLTLQEELAVDLEDDLEKAAATFALVEQATKQQNLSKPDANGRPGTPNSGSRVPSKTHLNPIAMDRGADPHKAKDSVLGEVRALQPNHESRLEAIERAEKARLRELENRRGGEFARELGNFVEEGKLKKTGGVEEVERIRKVREEKARQEVLERQRQRMQQKAEKEAARAAGGGGEAAAAEAQTNGAPPPENAETAGEEGKLDVPPAPDGGERESSPEPGFVDAKEEVATTPVGEQGPPT